MAEKIGASIIRGNMCCRKAPRAGFTGEPRFPNRHGEPLCPKHAHHARDERFFPDTSPPPPSVPPDRASSERTIFCGERLSFQAASARWFDKVALRSQVKAPPRHRKTSPLIEGAQPTHESASRFPPPSGRKKPWNRCLLCDRPTQSKKPEKDPTRRYCSRHGPACIRSFTKMKGKTKRLCRLVSVRTVCKAPASLALCPGQPPVHLRKCELTHNCFDAAARWHRRRCREVVVSNSVRVLMAGMTGPFDLRVIEEASTHAHPKDEQPGC